MKTRKKCQRARISLNIIIILSLIILTGCNKYKIKGENYTFTSLTGYPGGAKRKVYVVLPPGYTASDEETEYPTIYLLHGAGCSIDEIKDIAKVVKDKSEFLYNQGLIKKMLVVIPHAATDICDGENLKYGSFYRDSDAIGHFKTMILNELITYIERDYNAISRRDKRSIGGFSMGGYGAFMLAMESSIEPGWEYQFCTVSSHSGLLSLEKAIETLVELPPEIKNWGAEIIECLIKEMEAAFSNGESLELDLNTGNKNPDVWNMWLDNDPLTYLTRHEDALRDMPVYIDCGVSDELGVKEHAELFHDKLLDLNLRHGFDVYKYDWTSEEWLKNILSGHFFLKERIPMLLLVHSLAF